MTSERRCRVVRAQKRYEGRQDVSYLSGISAESVGATGLCMHLVTIPPGSRGRAHVHEGHETAIYVLRGKALMWSGEGLAERTDIEPGDFLYIPAGEPHLPVNASQYEPVIVVLARTDPNEQESVVLLPDLDDLDHVR